MASEEYWFLFGLAFVWMVFAAVCDVRKREVPNWLNFSLVGFALAYRAFYSAYSSEWKFFVFGLIGFAVFVALGNLFYYSRMFAGGDAKLLMGIGAVLPFESWGDFANLGAGFVILLFFVGAVYSLLWSVYIAVGNWKRFGKEFKVNYQNRQARMIFSVGFAILFVFGLVFLRRDMAILFILMLFFVFSFFIFVYLRAIDKCMVKLVSPGKLTEGDWILGDIKLRGYTVKKTVHGLSLRDILELRKAGKKVTIKEGIPFVPAILIAFLIMVFFLAVSGFGILELSSFLF